METISCPCNPRSVCHSDSRVQTGINFCQNCKVPTLPRCTRNMFLFLSVGGISHYFMSFKVGFQPKHVFIFGGAREILYSLTGFICCAPFEEISPTYCSNDQCQQHYTPFYSLLMTGVTETGNEGNFFKGDTDGNKKFKSPIPSSLHKK